MKTLNEFLKENPGITMLGFSWAVYWRMQLVLLAIGILFVLLPVLFE
jgi:hypothetical protein